MVGFAVVIGAGGFLEDACAPLDDASALVKVAVDFYRMRDNRLAENHCGCAAEI
jgi:hypothetical protein